MTDLAKLGLKLEGVSDFERGEAALLQFGKASDAADKAADRLKGSTRQTGQELGKQTKTTETATAAIIRMRKEANEAANSVGKMAVQSRASSSAMGIMGTGIKSLHLGIAAAAASFLSFGSAVGFFVSSTVEAHAVQAQLAQALASTAGVSGQTVESLNEHAAALQKMSTFGDEAIGTAQSILLTFTKISGETFPRATEAVLDLATRMKTDLNSAALQLGKALNDPIQGITALSRAGIQFTEDQKATIAALVESGDVMKAQTIILKEMEVQFGGSAKAARDTFGGALTALSNVFGDLFEVSVANTEMLRGSIEALTAALSSPAFVQFAQTVGTVIFGAISLLVNVLTVLVNILPSVASAAMTVAPALLVAFGPAILASVQALSVAIGLTLLNSVRSLFVLIAANPVTAFIATAVALIVYLVDWKRAIQFLHEAWAGFMYAWASFWGDEAGQTRAIEIAINARQASEELIATATKMKEDYIKGFDVGSDIAGRKVNNAMVDGGDKAAKSIATSMQQGATITGKQAQAMYEDLNGKVIKPLGNVLVEGGKYMYNQVTGAVTKAGNDAAMEMGNQTEEGGKKASQHMSEGLLASGQQIGDNLYLTMLAVGDEWSNALQSTMDVIIARQMRAQITLMDAQEKMLEAQAAKLQAEASQIRRAGTTLAGSNSSSGSSGSSRSSSSSSSSSSSMGGSLDWGRERTGFHTGPSERPNGPAVPGYAAGGDFVVPGNGGVDSKRVEFYATPGERVTVTPQNPASGADTKQGDVNITNVFSPKDMLAAVQTVDGNRAIMNVIKADPDAFRAALGVL